MAKELGFDGYLMNFECKIEKPDLLIEWLGILREELHSAIPGSLVIWYDSVLHDGQLRWQSALNDKNYRFFQATDGFFSDYHWQLENLDETLETYKTQIQPVLPHLSTYDIFYGNDIYGRGTYGGGKLNIHVALAALDHYPFSLAMFGQAHWYEKLDGFRDFSLFSLNE